jgi:hypothetical protein
LRFDGEEWTVYESEAGRVQLKLLVVREQGRVKELWVQKVPSPGVVGKTKIILNLREPNVTKLIDLIRGLDYIKLEGGATVRVDDSLIRQVFDDPLALDQAYAKDREKFKKLIQNDVAAKDVIALAHRREQVALFRRYIQDQKYFESVRENTPGKSAEKVWQLLFEANPWILGLGLGTRLLTSWDDDRLEQIVAGSNVAGAGKRVDAFMQTAGRIRSMVFAEIKTHATPCYRRTSTAQDAGHQPTKWLVKLPRFREPSTGLLCSSMNGSARKMRLELRFQVSLAIY